MGSVFQCRRSTVKMINDMSTRMGIKLRCKTTGGGEREEVEKKQMKEEKKHCLTLLSVFVVPLRIAIAWAETFLKNLIDSLLRTPMPKWRSMRASQGKSAVFGNNTT